MSIFDVFRNAAAPTPNSAQGNPAVPSASTPVPKEGGPASMPAAPDIKDTEKSPLAGFEKLWEIDPNKKAPESVVPAFNIDQKALSEAVSKMDFAGAVTPELAKKALEGDPAAFKEAINAAAQAAFAQSAQASGRLIEKSLSATVDKLVAERLPAMMKSHTIANHVATENPILDNPAVAPIAQSLRDQVMAKNPNASAVEVNNQVREYLAGFATLISSAMKGQEQPAADVVKVTRKTGGAGDDWSDFFGAGKQ